MKKLILAIAILLVIQGVAWGDTGNDFLQNCDNTNDVKQVWCFGFMKGFNSGVYTYWDSYVVFSILAKSTEQHKVDQVMDSCTPDTVTVRQMLKVVIDFLKNHPEKTHQPIGGLIVEAYQKAWPCPDSNNE